MLVVVVGVVVVAAAADAAAAVVVVAVAAVAVAALGNWEMSVRNTGPEDRFDLRREKTVAGGSLAWTYLPAVGIGTEQALTCPVSAGRSSIEKA